MINGYDIPEISYFENKNSFFGSEGKNFRYKIENSDNNIKVDLWYDDICFELANIAKTQSFELSHKGLEDAVEWIFTNTK